MNRSSITPDIKTRLSSVTRLERRIEATASQEEKPGYAPNQWGTYDDLKIRSKVLAGYRELVADFPGEDYFSYLLAGALCRANLHDEAVAVYSRLAADGGPYSHASMLQRAMAFYFAGDKAAAQHALDQYNAASVAKGEEPQFIRIEQYFPTLGN